MLYHTAGAVLLEYVEDKSCLTLRQSLME